MKLLFAHVFVVLVTVGIGLTTLPSRREVSSSTDSTMSKRPLSDPDQRPVFQISGKSLDIRAGDYVLNANFRREFFILKRVDIPASEYDLRKLGTDSVERSGKWTLKSLIVENESIAFQTREFNGESYSFTGSFRPNTRCSPTVVTAGMDGQLTKFRDGVLVATIEASFDLVYVC